MSEAHNPLNLEETEPESVLPPVGKIGGSIIELAKYPKETSEYPTPSRIFDRLKEIIAADNSKKIKRLVGEASILSTPNAMIDLIVYNQDNSTKVDSYYSDKVAKVDVHTLEQDDEGVIISSFESFGIESVEDGSLCLMQYGEYDEETGQREVSDISGDASRLKHLGNLLKIESELTNY